MTLSNIEPERLLDDRIIAGGGMWSQPLRRHNALRFTDLHGGANVALLLFNLDHLLERYNMADTLKAQHTAHLTRGHVLYSDMGRILCSVTDDTCGWHDPLGGVSDAALVRLKYGERRYQEHRNGFHRNGRDSLLNELAKWGLGLRDLTPTLNLFSKVRASDGGALEFVAAHSRPGAHVELRAEMNVLVVLATCQHPLDPAPAYAPKPVRATLYRAAPPGPQDACRTSCPENTRGFSNTERYFL